MFTTIRDVWSAFDGLHRSGPPFWDVALLEDTIHHGGWRYEEITLEMVGELHDEERRGDEEMGHTA